MLGPVLRETLRTIVFQEQVIEAMALADFSSSEAEGLRRAMSRKRSEAEIESTTSASLPAPSPASTRRRA